MTKPDVVVTDEMLHAAEDVLLLVDGYDESCSSPHVYDITHDHLRTVYLAMRALEPSDKEAAEREPAPR